MENILDIASWFLNHDSMTHKKVQKLCYYAQAWYCALYDGEPLFETEIQAWIHGPVIPALYEAYSSYEWNPIPKIEFFNHSLDQKTVDILETVYETYGQFSGDQLESLTRSEDPWVSARGRLAPWEPGTAAISCSSMREYYRRKYEQEQND